MASTTKAEPRRMTSGFVSTIVILLTIIGSSSCSLGEPTVDAPWGFRAVGEIVVAAVEDCNFDTLASNSSIYFEETHYNDGTEGKINKSAFHRSMHIGHSVRKYSLYEDFLRQKIFIEIGTICSEMQHFGPQVASPVYTVLSEFRRHTEAEGDAVTERGLAAIRFRLNFTASRRSASDDNTYIEYASITFRDKEAELDQKWTASGLDYVNDVPMTVEICATKGDPAQSWVERLSITGFAWNVTDESQASPSTGLNCEHYGDRQLPKTFSDARTLLIRTEFTNFHGKAVSSDVAVDFERKLLRIDDRRFNSYLYSASQGLIYNVTLEDAPTRTCQVHKAAQVAKFDWTFIDFKLHDANDLFGITENFTVKSKTQRRGIDCQLISGQHLDYPSIPNKSNWEWCVASVENSGTRRRSEYMVELNIFHSCTSSENCQRESYSLYHTEIPDPKELYYAQFSSLDPCFSESNKVHLQVTIDELEPVKGRTDDTAGTAVESVSFKARFLDRLLAASKLPPDAYRFGSLHVTQLNRSAILRFSIMGTPEEAEATQESLEEVRARLESALHTGADPIIEEVNGFNFQIRQGSLKDAEPFSPLPQPEPTTSTPTTVTTSQSSTSETTLHTDAPEETTAEPTTTQQIPSTEDPNIPPKVNMSGYSEITLVLAAVGGFFSGGLIGAFGANRSAFIP